MPIPTLRIEDQSRGLPRTPVPLRLACHVVPWGPQFMLELLANDDLGLFLDVYAFEGGHPRLCAREPYAALGRNAKGGIATAEILSLIPVNHFVWSSELAQAFSTFIDRAWDRDAAREAGVYLNWEPALGKDLPWVEECSDLAEVAAMAAGEDLTPQARRKLETQKRHDGWRAEYQRLSRLHTTKSDRWIAHQISKDPAVAEGSKPDTIRKNMKPR